MAEDIRAKLVQSDWQIMLQNKTRGRGGLRQLVSNQPKPRDGREQTAQGGARMAGHDAYASEDGAAFRTSDLIAPWLNRKVIRADA